MTMVDENKRVPTGIEGFDEMTNGGFPKNAINVLSGRAGSGKTLFSIHYAVEGALREENTVYISVDDVRESVIRASKQYDIPLKEAIEKNRVRLYDYEGVQNYMQGTQSMVGFEDLTKNIDSLIAPVNADRLVVDSVAGLGIAEDSVNQIRRNMLEFIRRIRENDLTAILVTERWEDKLTRYGAEEYVGDSLVVLGLEQMQNQMDRSINIRKMRYTDHDTSFRPIEITEDGLQVYNQGQVF